MSMPSPPPPGPSPSSPTGSPVGSQPYGRHSSGPRRLALRAPAAPPLDARQKRGTFWAGFLALNLIYLGGSLVLLAVGVGLVLSFASWAIRLASTGEPGSALGQEPRALLSFLSRIDAPLWLVLLAAAGLILLAVGVLVSSMVLSRHGIDSPWAVTWSAVGLSMPALVAVGGVLSFASQIGGTVVSFGTAPWWGSGGSALDGADIALGVTLALGGLLVSLAVVGIVGWLLWWWMAHLLRAPART